MQKKDQVTAALDVVNFVSGDVCTAKNRRLLLSKNEILSYLEIIYFVFCIQALGPLCS